MNKFLKQTNKGFTLVETLVALSIFSMAVVVMMSFLGQSVSDTGYAKKKQTAAYLAQEGVEYMRNLRDTYMLYSGSSQVGWDNFTARLIGSCQSSGNGCYFDDRNVLFSDVTLPITDLILTPCPTSTCSPGELRYDSTTGKYGYVSGTLSGYTRKITVSSISSNEMKVSATVSWTQKSGNYSITFSENMFHWIE